MYGLNIDPANPKGNPATSKLRDLGVQTVRYSYKDAGGGSQLDPQRVRFYSDHLQQLNQAGLSR